MMASTCLRSPAHTLTNNTPSGHVALESSQLMIRHFLRALPFAILVEVLSGVEARMGCNEEGTFWIYSCSFHAGASVGSEGFKRWAWSQEPDPLIGSQADFGNKAIGCE